MSFLSLSFPSGHGLRSSQWFKLIFSIEMFADFKKKKKSANIYKIGSLNGTNENNLVGGSWPSTLQITLSPWRPAPCPQWWPFHLGIGKIFSQFWKWGRRCWGWLGAGPAGSKTLECFHWALRWWAPPSSPGPEANTQTRTVRPWC